MTKVQSDVTNGERVNLFGWKEGENGVRSQQIEDQNVISVEIKTIKDKIGWKVRSGDGDEHSYKTKILFLFYLKILYLFIYHKLCL